MGTLGSRGGHPRLACTWGEGPAAADRVLGNGAPAGSSPPGALLDPPRRRARAAEGSRSKHPCPAPWPRGGATPSAADLARGGGITVDTMLQAAAAGLNQLLSPQTFLLMMLSIVIGFIIGILPGISAPTTLALMLPFTFSMKPHEAFAFLLGMLSVSIMFGDVTSILFGVPGEPLSASVILDGHPMAKKGETGRALGAVLMSSLVGSVIGAIALAASIPVIRPVVLAFGSPEFFGLALVGILFIAVLSGGNATKGVVAGALGLMLSMVGLDPQSGVQRYTFGHLELWDGIKLVPVTVGLFGVGELVDLWVKQTSISERRIGD